MSTDELDQLLMDRFNLDREDLIAALKALPAQRPWATALTEEQADLLDSAGFTAEPAAYAPMAAEAIAHMGRLYNTSYTAAEVAKGLGVNDSRVRQRRLAKTLWAIDDGGTWVYPSVQFEDTDNGSAHGAQTSPRPGPGVSASARAESASDRGRWIPAGAPAGAAHSRTTAISTGLAAAR